MAKNIIQVEEMIISILKNNVDEADSNISSNTPFSDLQIDSLKTMMVMGEIEKKLQLSSSTSLDTTSIHLYPTINDLAKFIVNSEKTNE